MKQEKKPELLTQEAPCMPNVEPRRLQVEELETRVAPNAIWGD